MKIIFKGNKTQKNFFKIGVMANNKVDNLEMYFKLSENVEINNLRIFLKMNNSDFSFVNKEPIRNFDLIDNNLIIYYTLTRKVTKFKNIDMQVQFEYLTDDDIEVWQTQIFNITFDDTIAADEYIEEENPDILQDYEKRLTDLEAEPQRVVEYDSQYSFPNIGISSVIYIDKAANKTYRFNQTNNTYYCIGSDYSDIKIINCNGG